MSQEIESLDLRHGFSGRGALSVVVFEPTERFAYKLFKSSVHPANLSDPFPEPTIRRYFDFELRAYQIVAGIPELAKHTASFFGASRIASVVDQHGANVSEHYLLDCCLKLELLRGQDEKLDPCKGRFSHLQPFAEKLHRAGVHFTLDTNVFNPADPENFKIIDFAVGDAAVVF